MNIYIFKKKEIISLRVGKVQEGLREGTYEGLERGKGLQKVK